MFLSTAIPLAAIFISSVWAQLDRARCSTGFDWNRNSLGHDPCTVGSILDASCRGLAEYTYPSLDSTQYYLPPRANRSGDIRCDCNTVMYSLYMACASCQEGEIYSWTKWIPECSNVYISQYTEIIPEGTAVPGWAYYDITSLPDRTWNASAIAMNAAGPEFWLNDPPFFAYQSLSGRSEELLKRADPEPSTVPPVPSTTPDSVSPTISTPSSLVSQGKTTSIRVQSPPPGPTDPTSVINDPAIPTDATTSSPGPTTPIGNPNLSQPTVTSRSTSSPRPTSATGNPSSGRPTNPFGTNANSPVPTNSGSVKSGTNFWAIVVAVSLCVLI